MFKKLLPLYQIPAYYSLLLLFVVICLAYMLASKLFGRFLSRKIRVRYGRPSLRLISSFILKSMKVSRLVNFHYQDIGKFRDQKPIIFLANHPAAWDSFFFISSLPRLVCIAKSELWRHPLYGGTVRVPAYIHNSSPRYLLECCSSELKAGAQILIFPEGTRTAKGKNINEFHRGFASIAKRASAPIQTFFIRINSSFLAKNWPIYRLPKFPVEVTVKAGRRFSITKKDNPKVAAKQIRDYFLRELDK